MHAWGRPRSSAREKERLDSGGLTANNDHIGGVEDLTRERKSAQSADRVVVKYLDRKARAPTANRRSRSGAEPRSGVGGARLGVREYGAVNYHKVELKEQRNETFQQMEQTRHRRSSFRLWRGGNASSLFHQTWRCCRSLPVLSRAIVRW